MGVGDRERIATGTVPCREIPLEVHTPELIGCFYTQVPVAGAVPVIRQHSKEPVRQISAMRVRSSRPCAATIVTQWQNPSTVMPKHSLSRRTSDTSSGQSKASSSRTTCSLPLRRPPWRRRALTLCHWSRSRWFWHRESTLHSAGLRRNPIVEARPLALPVFFNPPSRWVESPQRR